ncbi:MAG: Cupin 2 conserved barrel domain protein [Actinomycetospora sp.]|nr:Cupin 2 conserved barrel domain protein [Actinomycetospora sp.]
MDASERGAAPAGTLILAARGMRHTVADPHDRPARAIGVWSPASAQLADIHRRHDSEIAP